MSEQVPIPQYPIGMGFYARLDGMPVTVKPHNDYVVDRPDAAFSLVTLVLGFLAWNWIWPRFGTSNTYLPGISVTLYFVLALACSLAYFKIRKIALSKPAIAGAGLILLWALPFAIYATTPVHIFGGMALCAGYVAWHAIAAGTAVSTRPDGMIGADVLNQAFVVPWLNGGSWFSAARHAIKKQPKSSHLWFAIVGVLVALPVIVAVLLLLIRADANFDSWMSRLVQSFVGINLWHFAWQLILGFPIAILLFALLYGNAHRRRVDVISRERVGQWGAAIRKIPAVAIASPMAILCLMYVVFFAAMGSYFMSAMWHKLPEQFTLAEYARRGFFELTAVAAINLAVIGFAYWFSARGERGLPKSLRVLGGTLCGLTLLLIVTAISKMLLYIDQLGLTRLRLYTLWFMVVMFIVFALIGARHIKQFNVGVPVVLVTLLAFFALMWANTDGLIAQYDVNRVLNGTSSTVDVDYLGNTIGEAAVPALTRLANDAVDPGVRSDAAHMLTSLQKRDAGSAPWTSWTWQGFNSQQLLGR